MKIRGTLIWTLALALGISGCASAGGGASPSGGGGGGGGAGGGGITGERPRETADTRAAQQALDDAADADTPDAAQPLYQQALQSAQAELAADSLNPLGQRLAGEAYLGLEDYAQAADYLDKAEAGWELYELELEPIREQAYIDLYQKASPFLQSGDYEQAAQILSDANTIYPDRPEAVITLAQIYAALRQDDKALDALDQAQAFFDSDAFQNADADTQANWKSMASGLDLMRGQVLVDQGKFEDAVNIYRQVHEANPDSVSITQDLAAILMQMGQQDSAMVVYHNLLNRSDLSAQDYYRIGVGFYQASDYGSAADAFEKDVQESSKDRDGIEMWARSLQLDSAFAAVPPVARRWIELDPASQIGITVLAQALNASGDAQQAGQVIQRVEALPFSMDDLQMRAGGRGGATVTGTVTNKTLDEGATVNLNFTFYDDSGASIGTQQQSIQVGAPGIGKTLQVDFDSDQQVGGYGYTFMAP